ncbi:MAG TPA: (2Fe-2S)-binding protein [Clostridiales bacterium]|nr:(2Fe-2S)-binding protein [Clostridiales bacterium]
MKKIEVSFKLNGKNIVVETVPNKRLLDMLREDLDCTSVKEGCGEGECGACTVLINNEAVTSCTVLAPQVEGCEVLTVEGLGDADSLDKLQETFIQSGAVQCGFCTPGMLLSAKALLIKNPHPSTEDIKTAIEGNLCRCTGYKKIITAVENAVGK